MLDLVALLKLWDCYLVSLWNILILFWFFKTKYYNVTFLGKVDANTMIVMDSFALPVEGTETRVNAQAQAYEYMTAYIEAAKQVIFIITACRTV